MEQSNQFQIDEITNSIKEVSTGKSIETIITEMTAVGIKKIQKKEGWQFNWKKEFSQPKRKVYKLTINESDILQGLISLEKMDGYIEMHLVENAPHNFGSKKQFAGVAGNLVAFACKISFEAGFDGFVAFTAKTRLVQHYIDTLGAQVLFGRERMGIFTKAAMDLVNSYFKNDKNV